MYKDNKNIILKENNSNLIKYNTDNLNNTKIYKIENFNILINKNNQKHNYTELPNELKTDIENLIKKYKNLKIENEYVNTEHIDENEFQKKIWKGYNYPPYPNRKDVKNLLIHIRNYLINKNKNTKKALYPNYINDYENNKREKIFS